MNQATKAAALLGRRGGAVKSELKAERARINGALGGRPRNDGKPIEREADPALAYSARIQIVSLGHFLKEHKKQISTRELARIQAAILSFEAIAKRSDA